MDFACKHKCWLTVAAAFLLTLLVQLIYSISISPLYGVDGFDSAVYEYLGLAWTMGKFPYYDIFEGKGPLLFLVNALGWTLHDRSVGIFMLQTINYTLVCLLWHRTARLFTSGWQSLLSVAMTLAVYILFNEEGNLTEDWSMLPISYSMYLLLRSMTTRSLPCGWEYFLAGIGAGAVTMIRMNNMPITVTLALYTMYILLRDRAYRDLITKALTMFAGFLIPILAFTAYFYAKWGSMGVDWLFYGTVWYNFDYAQNHDGSTMPIYSRIGYWSSVILLLFASRKAMLRDKRFLCMSLLLYVFTYAVLGKSLYPHYFLIVLPVILLSSSLAFSQRDRFIVAYLVCCVPFMLFKGWSNMQYIGSNGEIFPTNIHAETDRMFALIPEADRDSVFNYNDHFVQLAQMKRHGIMQCNRIVGLMTLNLSRRLHDETCHQLSEQSPRWVIASREWTTAEDSTFMSDNYELVHTTSFDMSREWWFCDNQMRLYRRRNK